MKKTQTKMMMEMKCSSYKEFSGKSPNVMDNVEDNHGLKK